MREIVGILYSMVEVLETIASYLEPATAETPSVGGESKEAEPKEEPKEEEVVVKKTTRSK